MPFKGHFDSFFISKIFQFLNEENKTGVLTLKTGDKKAFILIRDGRIVYVRGCNDKSLLGKYLVRKGVLSEQVLDRVVEKTRNSSNSFGKILLESRLATVDELKKAVESQATEILYDVFSWESGIFNFDDAEIDGDCTVFFEINVMKLIFDAARRIDEMAMFERNIESDAIVLKISENIKKRQSITLDAEAWQILSLIDGKRTVRQVVDQSDFSRFDVYKVISAMLSADLLTRTSTAPPESATEKSREKKEDKKNGKFFSLFKRK